MRGGKREGAGRKPDPANEKTKILSVRLPLSVYNSVPIRDRAAFVAAAIESHASDVLTEKIFNQPKDEEIKMQSTLDMTPIEKNAADFADNVSSMIAAKFCGSDFSSNEFAEWWLTFLSSISDEAERCIGDAQDVANIFGLVGLTIDREAKEAGAEKVKK